jgi:hypothetical protein
MGIPGVDLSLVDLSRRVYGRGYDAVSTDRTND